MTSKGPELPPSIELERRRVEIGAYVSWRQVAGYFDGDGNVGFQALRFVLKVKMRFIDTWRPQVEAVRSFLESRGIHTSKVGAERSGHRATAYRIEIGSAESLLKAARAMLPFCEKKSEDLRIAIEYLEGRITGNQAIARLNEEVTTGRRSGYLRSPSLPLKRAEGIRLKELENARKAREAHRVKVDEATLAAIHKDKLEAGLGEQRLSRKYGLSEGVIRRILREFASQSR